MGEHVILTEVHTFGFCLFHTGRYLMLDLSFFQVTGSKSSVHTPLNYLAIISPPFIPSASTSATMRVFTCMTDLPAISNITKVTVFFGDKLVVYSGMFEAAVREVVSQWEDFHIGE